MRTYAGPLRHAVRLIAVAMSVYHLVVAFVGTPEEMATDVGVPLHPGAEKYYREAGVL